jgi:hypothetical protein
MELVGEEKRIQALFSDARLADAQTAPSFAGVWNRAQAKTRRPQRAFNLSFVAATALLVCALVSLAWWVNRSQRSQEVRIASAPLIVNNAPQNLVSSTVPSASAGGRPVSPAGKPRSNSNSRVLKSTAKHKAVTAADTQQTLLAAKAIESWQSPTAGLLDSSSDALLKSLPQLNQNADEMKSFLPKQPK